MKTNYLSVINRITILFLNPWFEPKMQTRPKGYDLYNGTRQLGTFGVKGVDFYFYH